MNINPFGPYYAGALRTAIASCFINGKIKEQQIDFVKEVILGFREAEIEHLGITALEIYWIELLHRNKYLDEKEYESIFGDCEELVKIFVARCKKLDSEV